MNLGFEQIVPTPGYPIGVSVASLSTFKWGSKANVVVTFKEHVWEALYKAQVGRCCFCHRTMMDEAGAHLEHFVDKAQYSNFTFEIRNLALACPTCNVRKNGRFAKLAGKLRREAKRSGKPYAQRCPVLTIELAHGATFPASPNDFRWVNPHVDIYSSHIEWSRGWIFCGKTKKGLRTIRGVRLNEIAQLEKREMSSRLTSYGGIMSFAVGAIAELNTHTARDLGYAVGKEIARRRALKSGP